MTHTLALTFEGAWKVLLAGLIFGAGLPSLFAVGIRSMAFGAGGDAEEHVAGATGPAPHVVGQIVGYLCFAIVLAAAVLGITYIVATGFGKALSFEHIYPTIVTKH